MINVLVKVKVGNNGFTHRNHYDYWKVGALCIYYDVSRHGISVCMQMNEYVCKHEWNTFAWERYRHEGTLALACWAK